MDEGIENIRNLEKQIFTAIRAGKFADIVDSNEFEWLQESVRGRLEAIAYLQSAQQREFCAIAVAYGRYKLIQRYRPAEVEESILTLSSNVTFILCWLHASLSAYVDRGIKPKNRKDLQSIPEEILDEVFQDIVTRILVDTESEAAAKESEAYLRLLADRL